MQEYDPNHDHGFPFDVQALMPRFSYQAHPAWAQLLFAGMIGLPLGGFLGLLFSFVWIF